MIISPLSPPRPHPYKSAHLIVGLIELPQSLHFIDIFITEAFHLDGLMINHIGVGISSSDHLVLRLLL